MIQITVYAFNRDQTVDVNQGPVPLSLVKKLKEDNVVYAIGNQKLRREAGIPGEAGGPKRDRLERIKHAHPDHDEYIVVDDQDLSGVESWSYYTPEEFMEKMEEQNEP